MGQLGIIQAKLYACPLCGKSGMSLPGLKCHRCPRLPKFPMQHPWYPKVLRYFHGRLDYPDVDRAIHLGRLTAIGL